MAQHRAPGRGKLAASLSRVAKDEVTSPPTTERKTGLEVVREKFQWAEGHKPQDRVVVWDHDANEVLFSGSPDQFKQLKKALAGDK